MRLKPISKSTSKLGSVTCLLLCLGCTAACHQAWSQPSRAGIDGRTPNIILIVADDLGYGDLGSYGQKRILTPNLDRLAARGTRFTSFYAGGSVCLPSLCAMMTGMHSGHSTIRGNVPNASLAPGDVTLPQLLQGRYNTGLVGKWGLGEQGSAGLPGLKGIDVFIGYLNQKRAYDYYATYVDRFDTNEGLRVVEFPANANGARVEYFPDLLQKALLNFVRIHRPAPFNDGRPFFLIHTPSIPHAGSRIGGDEGSGMPVPDDKPYSDESWPKVERSKAAMISRLDGYVGEIVDRLKEYRQETNTLILITSDNGPHDEGGVDPTFFQSAGTFRGIKGELYEGGIRVPLIAVWPGKIPGGRVSDEPWAFWDLLPTLAEMADARTPRNIDGLSYLPELLGNTQTNRHEYFYWESHENGFQQAVRSGQWKSVRPGPRAPLELYDLRNDPGETRNVAVANQEVVTRMEKYLKSARSDSAHYPVAEPTPGPSFPKR